MRTLKLTVVLAVLISLILVPVVSAKTVMRVGLGDAEGSDQWALGTRFRDLMSTYSNGEIEIQLFPNGALGSEQEMVQNARLGTLDMAIVAINNITPFAPSVGVLTLPYLIQDHYDAVKVTTGALGKSWSDAAIKEAGVRMLGWCYSNFRVLTNSKRPVKKLEDLQGLVVRVPKNAIMIDTYKAWGINPTPMAWDETFTALQQKVVDGQDNPHIVNYTMKFYEVQKYISNVHYNYALQPLVMGEMTYQKMSPEMRALVDRCGMEAQQYALLFQLMETENAKQAMIKEGMELHDLEDEDKWIELAQTKVWPKHYDKVGGKAKVDAVLKAMGR